jgi:ABC-type antimicrobial peptide transport system permease subunit
VGGIYTLMSFLVQQRTREIGIRTALGADPGTLLRDIFSRSMAQLTLGLLLGFGLLALFLRKAEGPIVGVSLASAALVLLAGTAACLLPPRRALRIEPTQVLRSD